MPVAVAVTAAVAVAPLLARVVQLRIMTGDLSCRSGSDDDMLVLLTMLLFSLLLHVAGV